MWSKKMAEKVAGYLRGKRPENWGSILTQRMAYADREVKRLDAKLGKMDFRGDFKKVYDDMCRAGDEMEYCRRFLKIYLTPPNGKENLARLIGEKEGEKQ